MNESDLKSLVREIIREASRTQDKRLSSFTNKITRAIMDLYLGRSPRISSTEISAEDLIVDPSTSGKEIYEINAGFFPLAFDPSSIDEDEYEDGIDTFLSVVLEIERDSDRFNVSASDKNITGLGDIGIHVAIDTPVNFSKSKFGILRDEVANAVRHELEHVTQGSMSDQPGRAFNRDSDYFNFLHGPDDVESKEAKYLLRPYEIPAHIKGYAQNARSIKDFSNEVEDFLDGYIEKNFITKSEKEIILKTWLDWAQRRINRKGY